MSVHQQSTDKESKRQRVLLLCNDTVGENMAGPGIRYWEFARVLAAAGLEVTLAVLPGVSVSDPIQSAPFHYCRNAGDVRALAAESDVIVTHGMPLSTFPFLVELGKPLALDFYVPYVLEKLHIDTSTVAGEHVLAHESYLRAQAFQARQADFVICASEKQRDYWLGVMAALGRVNPYTHRDDPSLRRLIDVVPFGLPAEPPRHERQVLKGVHPGISAQDKVLLWGGGIWNWLDAPTLIRAMSHLFEKRPDIKLFFMGTQRPNLQTDKMQAVARAISLSQELGLLERTVLFNDWVPYDERANYLLEADVGVSLHKDHLETRFSFRTRFLDYLWAVLPILATRGDVLSEQIASQGLGRVVEPGDVAGVVEAILDLVDTPDRRQVYRPRFEQAAAAYRWETVARPLVEFCLAPRFAPDKAYLHSAPSLEIGPTPWWRLPAKAWRVLRHWGPAGLSRQIKQYRDWLLKGRGGK